MIDLIYDYEQLYEMSKILDKDNIKQRDEFDARFYFFMNGVKFPSGYKPLRNDNSHHIFKIGDDEEQIYIPHYSSSCAEIRNFRRMHDCTISIYITPERDVYHVEYILHEKEKIPTSFHGYGFNEMVAEMQALIQWKYHEFTKI